MDSLIREFFSRHERAALQFSSGKDSAAVLWLLEPYWDQVDVVWMNPGNPYPETLEYMQEISEIVPRFICVMGNQPQDIKKNGWPADIVPMESTEIGMVFKSEKTLRLRPFWECCSNNMWRPLEQFVKGSQYTGVIRGQKLADSLKGPTHSGTIHDGVEYFFPIDNWTDEQVFDFLGDRVPPSYKRGLKSSLDCMNCTAYMQENPGRIADLEKINKQAWEQVSYVHMHLVDSLARHSESLRKCHGHATAV